MMGDRKRSNKQYRQANTVTFRAIGWVEPENSFADLGLKT